MTDKQKHTAVNKTLASSMRLFVLIRECLTIQNTGKGDMLFDAVSLHANLCGMLLPDKLRMTQAELVALVAQLRGPIASPLLTQTQNEATDPRFSLRRKLRELTGKLPAGMQALTPDLKLP